MILSANSCHLNIFYTYCMYLFTVGINSMGFYSWLPYSSYIYEKSVLTNDRTLYIHVPLLCVLTENCTLNSAMVYLLWFKIKMGSKMSASMAITLGQTCHHRFLKIVTIDCVHSLCVDLSCCLQCQTQHKGKAKTLWKIPLTALQMVSTIHVKWVRFSI